VLALAPAEPLVRDVHDIAIYKHAGGASASLHLKLVDPDVSLAEAHEVAERVEAAIRADSGVDDVYTHREPLERPWSPATSSGRRMRSSASGSRAWRSTARVRSRAKLRLLHTDDGLVVFVSVVAAQDIGLPDAHEHTSRLEDDICEGQPHVTDVVVYTEP
jgi:divalent metal cation (Fe/Co/Zn/Cd) transporter